MSNFNLKSSTTITIVSIFPIIKFYKSALAQPQVARDNLGGPVNVRVKNIYFFFRSCTCLFIYNFIIRKDYPIYK